MSPEEATNQTSYTYTCAEGLQTADGDPQTVITCLEGGLYDPPLPHNCSRKAADIRRDVAEHAGYWRVESAYS